ncbi:MAG: 16S rRNA (guanine(527)-N(7))-methyltransferase RsmG [Candidatus Dormibacteria bacterium]
MEPDSKGPPEPSPDELEDRLRHYLDLLLERNRTRNLTAVRDPVEAWQKLILGSLAALDAHRFRGDERVADVGAGGGVPGIPLALALPGIRLTMVESDQHKAAFLREVAAELGLEADVLDRRAEVVGRESAHRDAYDVVVTRAAAKAPVAAEYCLPLVKPAGFLLAFARERDWRDIAGVLPHLGGRIAGVKGEIVIVRKMVPTPAQYPRRVGVPGKRPLGGGSD